MPRQPLLEAIRQAPFRPFRLHLTGGTTYETRHPEMVMVGPGYAVVGLPGDSPPAIERHEIVDLLHVIRLEPLESAASTGDGKKS